MKKPVLKMKVKDLIDGEDSVEVESPKREFTLKEQITKLDDPRKKAFFKYHRWKNSLLNEKNVKCDSDWKLLMGCHLEY
jgi:hypothetical protein